MPRAYPHKGVCTAPNCERYIYEHGLCEKHYQRLRRHGSVDDIDRRFLPPASPETSKCCGSCNRELPIENFGINRTKHNPFGRKSFCRKCVSAERKKLRESRAANGLCLYCDEQLVTGYKKCDFHLKERIRYRATITARVNQLLTNARRRAIDKGTICAIDEHWVRAKLLGRCELTGLPFDLEAGGRKGHFNPYAPTIDKILPGDYTPENSRMVVAAINMGLNAWGEEVYRIVAKAYLHHRRERKHENRKNTKLETYNLPLGAEFTQLPNRTRKH